MPVTLGANGASATTTITGMPEGTTYSVAVQDQGWTMGNSALLVENIEKVSNTGSSGTIAASNTPAVFTNARKLGDLAISKTVTSPVGNELDDAFRVRLTLDPIPVTKTYDISASDNNIYDDKDEPDGQKSSVNITTGKVTFSNAGVAYLYVKGGQTLTIANLPTDVACTLEEKENDGSNASYSDYGNPTYDNQSAVIANDGTVRLQTETITNTRNTGSLSVAKTVDSDVTGDKTHEFQFRLTLTPPTGHDNEKLSASGFDHGTNNGTVIAFADNVAVFVLKDDDTQTITSLPAGWTYVLEELPETISNPPFSTSDFTTTPTGDTSGTIAETQSVSFNNARKSGSLTLAKTITNPIPGDESMTFAFEVTLSRADGLELGDASRITVGGTAAKDITWTKTTANGVTTSATATVDVSSGTSITIANLPYGTSYSVTENMTTTQQSSFKATGGSVDLTADGTIAAATQSVTLNNERKTGSVQIEKVLAEANSIAAEEDEEYNIVVALTTTQGTTPQTVSNIPVTLTWKTGNTTDETQTGTFFADGTQTIPIKSGQIVTIDGIPVDVTYTVTEPDGTNGAPTYSDRFTTSINGASGDIQETSTPPKATVTNTREYRDLTIYKRVTGNMADHNRPFTFTLVSVTPSTTSGEYGFSQSGKSTIKAGDTFILKHGQSVTISDLPLNAVVVIREETGAYTATWTATNGVSLSEPTVVTEGTRTSTETLTLSTDTTLTATNKLTAMVETGIDLDVAPYVTLLLLLGAAAWLARRRRGDDEADA